MRDVALLFGAIEPPRPGLGRCLFEQDGVVLGIAEQGEAFVRRRLGVSLRTVVARDEPIPEALLSPVTTLTQIALFAALKERGLQPAALICRCVGEFAAAYAGGAISFEDALEVSCRLADFVGSSRGRGALIVVDLPCEDVEALSADCPVPYETIGEGNPSNAVLGCADDHAASVRAFFASRDIASNPVPMITAWHTRSVDEMRLDMLRPLSGPARPTHIPIYSATTCGLLPAVPDWARHFWRVVRSALSIRAAIGAALDDGFTRFVEVGERLTLQPFVELEARARDLSVSTLATMERKRSLLSTMDETLAALNAPAPMPSPEVPRKIDFAPAFPHKPPLG